MSWKQNLNTHAMKTQTDFSQNKYSIGTFYQTFILKSIPQKYDYILSSIIHFHTTTTDLKNNTCSKKCKIIVVGIKC